MKGIISCTMQIVIRWIVNGDCFIIIIIVFKSIIFPCKHGLDCSCSGRSPLARFWATSHLSHFTCRSSMITCSQVLQGLSHPLWPAVILLSMWPNQHRCRGRMTSTIGLMPTWAQSSSQGYLSLMVTPHIHRIIDISLRCNLWDSSTLISQVSLP